MTGRSIATFAVVLGILVAASCGDSDGHYSLPDTGPAVDPGAPDLGSSGCQIDDECAVGSECRTGICDSDGACSYFQLPDRCFVNGQCYATGQEKPADRCMVCDPDLIDTEFVHTVCDPGQQCNPLTGACEVGPHDVPEPEPDVPVAPDIDVGPPDA